MLLSPEHLHCDSGNPSSSSNIRYLPSSSSSTPYTSSFWLTPYQPSKACSGTSCCSTLESLNTFLPLWSPWVNDLCLYELHEGTHHVCLGPCYLLCLVECLTCTHTHKFLGKTKTNFSRLPFKHIFTIKCATFHCNCAFVFPLPLGRPVWRRILFLTYHSNSETVCLAGKELEKVC